MTGSKTPTEHLRPVFQAAAASHRAGRLDEAIGGYLQVLREAPDLVFVKDNLSLALLAAGDYARGLRLYEVRFDRSREPVVKPQVPFPEWQGEDLAGRSLLVWPEQGFGDQIMYARFARVLHDQGVKVTWAAPPELAPLFRHLPATVVEAGPELRLPRHDAWCMSGSLPLRTGATLDALPVEPYLPSEPQDAPPHGVGVMLFGRATPDPLRSLTPEAAAVVRGWPGVVSLAREDAGDFENTRRIISGLDCVVTIDTAIAHLAGAMGKPTLLMLPFAPDWRWMWDREDSPWYPSMRLYRQPAPGDWTSVLARVRAALDARGQ